MNRDHALKVPYYTLFQVFILTPVEQPWLKKSSILLALCLQPLAKMLVFHFLLKIKLCFSFYMFGRRHKRGSRDAISNSGRITFLGVFLVSWYGMNALCGITKSWFPEQCISAHTFWRAKQAKEVKDEFHSFQAIYLKVNFTWYGTPKLGHHFSSVSAPPALPQGRWSWAVRVVVRQCVCSLRSNPRSHFSDRSSARVPCLSSRTGRMFLPAMPVWLPDGERGSGELSVSPRPPPGRWQQDLWR